MEQVEKGVHLAAAHCTSIFKRIFTRTLQLGDVVLDEGKTRSKCVWDLVRIVETFPGKNEHVRACMAKRADGTLVKRPVGKLYRLEVS